MRPDGELGRPRVALPATTQLNNLPDQANPSAGIRFFNLYNIFLPILSFLNITGKYGVLSFWKWYKTYGTNVNPHIYLNQIQIDLMALNCCPFEYKFITYRLLSAFSEERQRDE